MGIIMLIGYARTSTFEQQAGLDAQLAELDKYGCDKVFSEQVSSVAQREQLESALDYCREGDTVVVTKMDRLARSVSHLIAVNDAINAKGAHLHILDFGMDTSTSTGRLMLNVLASVAQFEREVMLERQREGIAKAKAEGKYKGRKPTARAKTDDVISLRKRGVGATDIAKRLEIGRASVYRILADVSEEERTSA